MNTSSKTFRSVRYAIDAVVGIATLSAISAIVKNNTAEPETKTQKVAVGVSSFVLGTMVAEKASAWADRQLMGVVQGIEDEKAKTAASQNDTVK